MSIKLRAFSYTAGIFAAGAIAGLALIQIIEMLPATWIPYIGAGAVLALLFNFCYSITKAHLEYRAKLEEIAAKN
jgi:hypothetical protein